MITSLLCLDICANSAVLFTCTCTWSCESACLLYSAHASHAIKSVAVAGQQLRCFVVASWPACLIYG